MYNKSLKGIQDLNNFKRLHTSYTYTFSIFDTNFKNGSAITGMDQLRNWQKVIGQ